VAAALLAGTVLLTELLAGESSHAMLASARLSCYYVSDTIPLTQPAVWNESQCKLSLLTAGQFHH